MYKRNEKNAPLLGFLSLVLPGFGHIQLEDKKLGGILAGVAVVGWIVTFLFKFAIVIPIAAGAYAAYDCFTKAEAHNEEDFSKWLAAQDSTIKPGSDEPPPEVQIDVPQMGGASFGAPTPGGVQTVPVDEPVRPATGATPRPATGATPRPSGRAKRPSARNAAAVAAAEAAQDTPIEELGGMTIVAGGGEGTVRITGTAKFKRSHLSESNEDAAEAPGSNQVEWVSFGKK